MCGCWKGASRHGVNRDSLFLNLLKYPKSLQRGWELSCQRRKGDKHNFLGFGPAVRDVTARQFFLGTSICHGKGSLASAHRQHRPADNSKAAHPNALKTLPLVSVLLSLPLNWKSPTILPRSLMHRQGHTSPDKFALRETLSPR